MTVCLLVTAGAVGLVTLAALVAGFCGSNERGNDDSELWEPPDDH